MTFLASTERAQRETTQVASMGPGTFEIGGPAAFEGFGTATGLGIGRGLATTGAFLNEFGKQLPMYRMQESLSDLLGTGDALREARQQTDDAIRSALDYYRLDPQTTGFAGQVSYGVGATLLPAAIGTVTAGPIGGAVLAGGAVGTGTFTDLTAEGVDRETALGAAGIDALTTGIGVAIPVGWGAKVLTRVATGASANVVLGVGQRYAMSEYLRSNGYGEIAARYEAFDGMALATDLVLGAAFGLLPNGKASETPSARPRQSDVDAAMTARSAHHAEVVTAPGMPVDASSMNANVRASGAAINSLSRGEAVEVSAVVDGAQFVRKQDDRSIGADSVALAFPDAPPAFLPETAAQRAPVPATVRDVGDGLYEIRSPDGKLLGNALIDEDGPALTIRGVELDSGARGQGIGMAVYQQILDRAFREGKTLASDSEVTTDAARVYDAIERRGYTVKRNPAAKLGEDGKWRTPDESPVFEVTKAPVAQPTSDAAQPTSGGSAAMAGAEGRATEEAKAAESAIGEAMKSAGERPDAKVLYGEDGEDGSPMTIADAVDAIRAERDQAERDAQGITAAVMCFLRRGGE